MFPCHFLINLISLHFSLKRIRFPFARKFLYKWKHCSGCLLDRTEYSVPAWPHCLNSIELKKKTDRKKKSRPPSCKQKLKRLKSGRSEVRPALDRPRVNAPKVRTTLVRPVTFEQSACNWLLSKVSCIETYILLYRPGPSGILVLVWSGKFICYVYLLTFTCTAWHNLFHDVRSLICLI